MKLEADAFNACRKGETEMQTRMEFIKTIVGAGVAATVPVVFGTSAPDAARHGFDDFDDRRKYLLGYVNCFSERETDPCGSGHHPGKTCRDDMFSVIEVFVNHFHSKANGLSELASRKKYYIDENGNEITITREWLDGFYDRYEREIDARIRENSRFYSRHTSC